MGWASSSPMSAACVWGLGGAAHGAVATARRGPGGGGGGRRAMQWSLVVLPMHASTMSSAAWKCRGWRGVAAGGAAEPCTDATPHVQGGDALIMAASADQGYCPCSLTQQPVGMLLQRAGANGLTACHVAHLRLYCCVYRAIMRSTASWLAPGPACRPAAAGRLGRTSAVVEELAAAGDGADSAAAGMKPGHSCTARAGVPRVPSVLRRFEPEAAAGSEAAPLAPAAAKYCDSLGIWWWWWWGAGRGQPRGWSASVRGGVAQHAEGEL